MLFKRRSSPTRLEQARVMLWPRRSFARSAQYFLKRVLRVNATPYAIGIGVACGAFASFTPLIGLHFLVAFGVTYVLRGNMIAAALGTAVGNPLTFPLIWASTFRVGRAILGEPVHSDHAPQLHTLNGPSDFTLEAVTGFIDRVWPVIKPMLVGSVPLGLTCALTLYVMTYFAVLGCQKARDKRMAARAARPPRKKPAPVSPGVESDGLPL